MIQQHIYYIGPGGKLVQILRKLSANYNGSQYLTSPRSGWFNIFPHYYTNLNTNLDSGVSFWREKHLLMWSEKYILCSKYDNYWPNSRYVFPKVWSMAPKPLGRLW